MPRTVTSLSINLEGVPDELRINEGVNNDYYAYWNAGPTVQIGGDPVAWAKFAAWVVEANGVVQLAKITGQTPGELLKARQIADDLDAPQVPKVAS